MSKSTSVEYFFEHLSFLLFTRQTRPNLMTLYRVPGIYVLETNINTFFSPSIHVKQSPTSSISQSLCPVPIKSPNEHLLLPYQINHENLKSVALDSPWIALPIFVVLVYTIIVSIHSSHANPHRAIYCVLANFHPYYVIKSL